MSKIDEIELAMKQNILPPGGLTFILTFSNAIFRTAERIYVKIVFTGFYTKL